jgi:hypothetical protein
MTNGRSAVKFRISTIAVACAAVTAVLGVTSAHSAAAAVKSYCIDAGTVTVSDATPADLLQQFQLDTYATLGGAYTVEGFSIGTDGDAAGEPESLVDSLGDLDDIVSAFSLPGAVFHPVAAGACAVTPAPTPTPTPSSGGTATAPDATAASSATAAVGPPQGEEGIFLCYSTFQVDPGEWTYSVAQQLLAGGGYWRPYAVLGPGSSTQLGFYSLVCNPGKATQSVPTVAVEGGGDVTTAPSQMDSIDVYPVYP